MVIEKFKLPSNGLLGAPAEVKIKAMRGRELNMVYSSLSDASIDKIIERVTDPSLDPEELCDEDKSAILYYTRLLTFGEYIDQHMKCPHCGGIHKVSANYSEFVLTLLEEDNLKVVHLDNGDELHRRVPTPKIQKEIELFKKRYEVDVLDSQLLLMMTRIDKIVKEDGTTIRNLKMLFDYLADLEGRIFGDIIDNIDIKFGLNTTFEIECPETLLTFKGVTGINADFFRKSDRVI